MFRCERCTKQTKPGEKQTRLVAQTRHKDYYRLACKFSGAAGVGDWCREHQSSDCIVSVFEGSGTEIVRELRVGPCCLAGSQ